MKLNIRKLKESDWDILVKWWDSWPKWQNPPKEFLPNNPALFITSRKMHAQEIVDEGLPLNVNAEDIAKDFTLNNMLEYHDTWNSKEMEAFLAKGAFELDKEYKDLVKPVREEILNAVQEKYKSQIDPIRNSIVEEYQKIFTNLILFW